MRDFLIDCYNLYITIYNRFVDWWNSNATEDPEESIIPTSIYNQQIDEYNFHVDEQRKARKDEQK